jgi:hypothetical protein
MIFMPNKGRLDKKSGRRAQWIAQATDVAMPRVSELILIFMKGQKYKKATLLQNIDQV